MYAYLFRVIEDVPKIRTKGDWTGLVKMMIKEFFDNDIEIAHEEHAVEQFTTMRYFKDCANWALRERAVVRDVSPTSRPRSKEDLERAVERRRVAAERRKTEQEAERRRAEWHEQHPVPDPEDKEAFQAWKERIRAKLRKMNEQYERDDAE